LLPKGAAKLVLSMAWAKGSSGALSVQVTDPAGAPVVGARVRAQLTGTPPQAGTLTAQAPGVSDAILPATGSALAQGLTDDTGFVSLGLLPAGPYHLTAAPPASLASTAITSADVTLDAAGTSASIKLLRPLVLQGTLSPKELAAGARVTAIDRGPLAATTMPAADVDANGAYGLALAQGRTYELFVEPAAGRSLGRGVFAIVPSTFAGEAQSNVLRPGRLWTGTVTGGGRSVAGALVQVYCVQPPASCLDPTIPLAQGTTAPDGSLTLMLPAPPPAP
jgi:hypothetical protein